MRKYTIIVMIMFLDFCDLTGCGKSENSYKETSMVGDVGDESEPVDVSGFVFEELPACTIDNSCEYVAGNGICTVSDVTFTPTKIRLYVKFNSLSQTLENAVLTFKVGSDTVTDTISYVFSSMGYEVLLPKKSAEAFKLVGLEGIPCNAVLGEFKEFGFPVEKKGSNTLKCFGFHRIFILDQRYNVIDEVYTHGFSKKVINQGSKYYAEVML